MHSQTAAKVERVSGLLSLVLGEVTAISRGLEQGDDVAHLKAVGRLVDLAMNRESSKWGELADLFKEISNRRSGP